MHKLHFFLCFVHIKKTIQCLLASEVIQFDIMLHVAPKGKSSLSAWQPSITVLSVKYSGEVTQPWGAPELMGQDCYPDILSIVEFKKWILSEKVEIKSSSLKQSGAKLNGSNTRQDSVFSTVISVLEHSRTLQPGSQPKPFLSQHHCLFLEVCIDSKILQYSSEAVDVLAPQCVFPSRSLWCSRVVFESKLKTSLFKLT